MFLTKAGPINTLSANISLIADTIHLYCCICQSYKKFQNTISFMYSDLEAVSPPKSPDLFMFLPHLSHRIYSTKLILGHCGPIPACTGLQGFNLT